MVRLQNSQKFSNYGVVLMQPSLWQNVCCSNCMSFKIRSESSVSLQWKMLTQMCCFFTIVVKIGFSLEGKITQAEVLRDKLQIPQQLHQFRRRQG